MNEIQQILSGIKGGRYGFGYSTPFAGNSVGMAMTHGWLAGHTVGQL